MHARYHRHCESPLIAPNGPGTRACLKNNLSRSCLKRLTRWGIRLVAAVRLKSTQDWLLGSMWAAAVLPAAMFAVAAVQSYQSAFERAEAQVAHAVHIAHEHALRVLQTNELAFDSVIDTLGRLGDAESRSAQAAGHEHLRELVERIPELESISVWDASGRLLASSASNPSLAATLAVQRDFFRVHAAGKSRGSHFSELSDDPVKGSVSMTVSRRRERADGSFAGVIAATLNPSHFFDFYQELTRNQPGLSITLIRSNGTIITRVPSPPAAGMKAPQTGVLMKRVSAGERSGLLTLDSAVDGKRKRVAYRRIGDYPLYTSAAMEHEVVLKEWLAYLALLAGFTFPMAFALVYVSWIAWRRTRREYAALRKLNHEAQRRLKAEAALRQSQKLEAMGHLTGGVAHDVNNLLMVVNNNAHLLERLPPGSDFARPIASIKRAVESGARLTRQLLAFSRRQALHTEVIDLKTWMPSVVELLRHSVSHEVAVTCHVAPDVLAIEIDPAELELALINLAVNARDAMPQGGTLRIAVFNALPDDRLAAGQEFIQISVSDTGIGIPPDMLDRVFEPFFTTKEIGKGTGLGLSQVYGLCTQAGGTARVKSRLGKGTTVSMFLRATHAVAESPESASSIPNATGCVLLVEDNDDVAQATALLLSAIGYAVQRAGNVAQGIEQLDAQPAMFDVVLSDISMAGGADGLELALTLRDTRPGLSVVLMTGYTARLQAAVAAGFEVIAKPCAPEELAATLKRAMRRTRKGRSGKQAARA